MHVAGGGTSRSISQRLRLLGDDDEDFEESLRLFPSAVATGARGGRWTCHVGDAWRALHL